MYPMDLAFVHLCILLSVWFLVSHMYCTEMEPFCQAISSWFSRTGWREEGGFRKCFLLYEHFYSLHLRTLHCKGHWGRSLAVISICSQKSCHAYFKPDLESFQIFFARKCLSRCYLRCFLFVRQVLLDIIDLLQLDLESRNSFIPDLCDGILCCLCQATSVLFPFVYNGNNCAEGLWKTLWSYKENGRTAEWCGCWLLLLVCVSFGSGSLGAQETVEVLSCVISFSLLFRKGMS